MTTSPTSRGRGAAALVAGLGLAVVLVAGCGSDRAADPAPDPAAGPKSSSASPSAEPDDAADDGQVETVAIVTQTAVGGAVSPEAVPLRGAEAVRAFGAQFTGDRMLSALTEAVASAEVPDGSTLWAAVVARGCDTPEEVEVARRGDGVQVTPVETGGRAVQCLAPMTSVAVVLVPDAG